MNAAGVMLTAAATAFDRVANSYDAQFTHTSIGRAQRKQVWRALLDAIPVGSRILELNCGTGEDARFLASRGRSIVACDASPAMIEVARRSCPDSPPSASLEYRTLANEDLASFSAETPFDGAFSNFSGLNCLADLHPFARNLANLVRPGGRVLLCLWSPACAAEVIWYLLHGQPRKALRRFHANSIAQLDGVAFPVTYHTFRNIRRSFAPWFKFSSRRAVGCFVPPSYAEPWMSHHRLMLTWCGRLDQLCGGWPLLRDFGDHMLLEFVRCSP